MVNTPFPSLQFDEMYILKSIFHKIEPYKKVNLIIRYTIQPVKTQHTKDFGTVSFTIPYLLKLFHLKLRTASESTPPTSGVNACNCKTVGHIN